MLVNIESKIIALNNEIKKCEYLLKKGVSNPSELRNKVINYKLEIKNLKEVM